LDIMINLDRIAQSDKPPLLNFSKNLKHSARGYH
jgi:hypothetical protein